ncbi:hypothetical protein LguiA_026147 [Lonicera macranthoides]
MNSIESQRQDSLKRRWQLASRFLAKPTSNNTNNNNPLQQRFSSGRLGDGDDDLVLSRVVPPQVTVVLEGRSIGHRISLHKHASYHSLAKALRQMFVDDVAGGEGDHHHQVVLDLSNAVPGHLIAYEDMENDLLLVGDLNWKDFVRVAKRIRILPVKAISSRKGREGI